MMNKIILNYLWLVFFIFYGQVILAQVTNSGKVGVNIDNPVSTLDVNGNVAVTEQLYVGGGDGSKGDPGKVGQALYSQGDNKPPLWVDNGYTLPTQGRYFLKQSVIKNDASGLEFVYDDKSSAVPYNINEQLGDRWKVFDNLTFSIEPLENPTKSTKIVFRVELTASFDNSHCINVYPYPQSEKPKWGSYAVGIAIDDPDDPGKKILKAVRAGVCRGEGITDNLFYEEYILDDLFPSAPTSVYVVATYRAESPGGGSCTSNKLYLGRSVNGPSLIHQATVRIDVFEAF